MSDTITKPFTIFNRKLNETKSLNYKHISAWIYDILDYTDYDGTKKTFMKSDYGSVDYACHYLEGVIIGYIKMTFGHFVMLTKHFGVPKAIQTKRPRESQNEPIVWDDLKYVEDKNPSDKK
jgi:hypothetical protein